MSKAEVHQQCFLSFNHFFYCLIFLVQQWIISCLNSWMKINLFFFIIHKDIYLNCCNLDHLNNEFIFFTILFFLYRLWYVMPFISCVKFVLKPSFCLLGILKVGSYHLLRMNAMLFSSFLPCARESRHENLTHQYGNWYDRKFDPLWYIIVCLNLVFSFPLGNVRVW